MIRLILTALFLVFECQFSFADMGAIVPVASVSLHEPGQRAIIAHDEFEEILILATDLKTSQKTKVLRFIPFPSKPEVSIAGKNCFKRLEMIVKSHQLSYLDRYKMMAGFSAKVVEIRFHKKIGAHDVTIVRVNNFQHFMQWINEFFANKGFSQRRLGEKEAKIINAYLQKGFNYFVFDLVELTPETKSVEPLIYRFKTRYFYYPLLTSNLMKGYGTITLFVICNRGEIYKSLPSWPWQSSNTALITKKEM
ncbi:MAG: DUF2330 domain-containing protein [Candidatus Desulfofervidaceae bacterium]|nr:DUF2330 domain-containing protein [Candidatus Desulfofervidaceae bacterium]